MKWMEEDCPWNSTWGQIIDREVGIDAHLITALKIYRHYPTVLLARIWMTSLEALCAIYNHPIPLFLYKVKTLPGKLEMKIYCVGEESPRDECGSRLKS